MLNKGLGKKVTIYVTEDTQYHLTPLYEAILNYLLQKNISGATATRAMASFGPHHVMHTTKMETLTEHLPVRIEFVETPDVVDAVLPTLYEMVTDGLIEVQDTTIVKAATKDRAPEIAVPPRTERGP